MPYCSGLCAAGPCSPVCGSRWLQEIGGEKHGLRTKNGNSGGLRVHKQPRVDGNNNGEHPYVSERARSLEITTPPSLSPTTLPVFTLILGLYLQQDAVHRTGNPALAPKQRRHPQHFRRIHHSSPPSPERSYSPYRHHASLRL
ncbi:hypothetical protein GQ53DRAFT_16728 [Thozetella sp. PMI_491]|nr:hypothetical protein GQ53DRAFT_16728 [Thozetella sp. PMI_491]